MRVPNNYLPSFGAGAVSNFTANNSNVYLPSFGAGAVSNFTANNTNVSGINTKPRVYIQSDIIPMSPRQINEAIRRRNMEIEEKKN